MDKKLTLECRGVDPILAVKRGNDIEHYFITVAKGIVIILFGFFLLHILKGLAYQQDNVFSEMALTFADLVEPAYKIAASIFISVLFFLSILKIFSLRKSSVAQISPFSLEMETWEKKEIQFTFAHTNAAPGNFSHKVIYKAENIGSITLEPTASTERYLLTIQGVGNCFDADGHNDWYIKLCFFGFKKEMKLEIPTEYVTPLRDYLDHFMTEENF